MLNVLGNGGSGDEFRGCCNTKTQQYILDAIDRINELDPGGGGEDEIEFVDLTVTNIGTDTITVTPNKTTAEVESLVDDGKTVVYRLVVPQTVGGFAAGTYLLQTVMASSVGIMASAVATPTPGDLVSYVYAQATDSASGTIYIEDLGGGGVTPVQTTGTSTTDVMSQNAVSSMVFANPGTDTRVKIGAAASSSIADDGIEIGHSAAALSQNGIAIGPSSSVANFTQGGIAIGGSSHASGSEAVALGYSTYAQSEKALALGRGTYANHSFSVALGAGATTSAAGEINVGTGSIYTTKGYNGTNYRLISGVHDGQSAYDAMTVGQANALIDAINTALGSSIPHIGS